MGFLARPYKHICIYIYVIYGTCAEKANFFFHKKNIFLFGMDCLILQLMATKAIFPILATGALFLVGRRFFQKGIAAKNLNINVSKVDFNKQNKSFVLFIRVINPSNADINLKNVVGDCFWNGTAIATVEYLQPTVFKAGETVTLQIPVKLNLTALSLITDLITNVKKVINGTFEFKGVLNAENLVIPIDYKNKFSLI
jgi:LEA14-like dessication related protein